MGRSCISCTEKPTKNKIKPVTGPPDDDGMGDDEMKEHPTVGSKLGRLIACSWGEEQQKLEAKKTLINEQEAKRKSLEMEKKSNEADVKNIKLNKQNFIFDKIKSGDDIKKDYQINEILGTGAFGEVRKCMSTKTGHIRAVKIIKKTKMTPKEQKTLQTEINILKGMDHPNIVKIYEAYQDKRRYFIVTELCTGGQLFDQIIKRPYYSERDAAVVMKQVFSAIVYCHCNNIVHRDLKPENLLLESEGDQATIKVIDFGTSQSFDPDKKMKQAFGTPYYIAPEVLKGSYDSMCDMWSCGVILYILISG